MAFETKVLLPTSKSLKAPTHTVPVGAKVLGETLVQELPYGSYLAVSILFLLPNQTIYSSKVCILYNIQISLCFVPLILPFLLSFSLSP
jgi:hypothetical protein